MTGAAWCVVLWCVFVGSRLLVLTDDNLAVKISALAHKLVLLLDFGGALSCWRWWKNGMNEEAG